MTRFDTIAIVDWSAGKRAPARPSKDAIWIGVVRRGVEPDPVYCRSRIEAETWLTAFIEAEAQAGRRCLIGFDFPFGYPRGFVRHVTGSDEPLVFWDWLEGRITDTEAGENNRFDVASEVNRLFNGPGPFWGKPNTEGWSDVPFKKAGIIYDVCAERRACDLAAKASSSCFQLFFNPTVGSQALMGLPMLARLRRRAGVAVWPFQDLSDATCVFAEVWPGLIEEAVKASGGDQIRDCVQVRLLARAVGSVPPERLAAMLSDIGSEATEEGWILGTGHSAALTAGARMVPSPPPLRNDCFALPPGVHWTPVDEALTLLRGRLAPAVAVETVPLGDALGRRVGADVLACRSNPPLPNTAVDGYGFAGGRAEGVHKMPLVGGRAAAGDVPGQVPQDHAIRVLTGAALPDGVDTVVLQEDVTMAGDAIRFSGPVRQGANTRAAGEDVQAGEVILAAGRIVTAADLALLSATGVGTLDLRLPLRVGVLSTGDELTEAGEAATEDRIFDANRPMLLGLVRQFGHQPVDLGIAPDDRAALRRRLDAASREVDVILTSGGASAGDEDHMSALLQEAGAMALWRVAIKPGRPLALGVWQGKPVFGLPGNPVAAMVCTLIFARPAMEVLAGGAWTEPQGFMVPAGFSKSKKAGRREYLRARIRDGQVEVFASEGSGRISGLSWADGLVELPEPAAQILPGDPVRYIPYSSFGV